MNRRVLEANVRVEDEESTEDGVSDRVQGTRSEGSNGKRDETNGNDPAHVH